MSLGAILCTYSLSEVSSEIEYCHESESEATFNDMEVMVFLIIAAHRCSV